MWVLFVAIKEIAARGPASFRERRMLAKILKLPAQAEKAKLLQRLALRNKHPHAVRDFLGPLQRDDYLSLFKTLDDRAAKILHQILHNPPKRLLQKKESLARSRAHYHLYVLMILLLKTCPLIVRVTSFSFWVLFLTPTTRR